MVGKFFQDPGGNTKKRVETVRVHMSARDRKKGGEKKSTPLRGVGCRRRGGVREEGPEKAEASQQKPRAHRVGNYHNVFSRR